MARLLLLAVLLCPLAFSQQIYRTTDAEGNVSFTDQPPPSTTATEQVDLPPTNTTPAPPARPTPEPGPETVEEDDEPAAYKIAITSPANDTSIPMGPGNFAVNVTVQPALRENDALQLYIGGIPWGDPQQGTSWGLTNVFRGQQDLTVAVIDAGGKHLAMSPPIRVFVHRPSVNFRNRN